MRKIQLTVLAAAVGLLCTSVGVNAKSYNITNKGQWLLTNADLHIKTPFKIKQVVLHGGKQDGTKLLTIDNGVMRITLIPTRGMDIYKVKTSQVTLGWNSPVKQIVNPKFINLQSRNGLGWLEGFNEMMVRCGYEWTGHPGVDKGELLSLHGRAGNTPATEVLVSVDEKAPYAIHIRGELLEQLFKQVNFKTWTEMTIIPGQKSFSIHDKLTNQGDYPHEYQIIYHSNFAQPLLEKGSKVAVPVKQISPFNEYAKKGLKNWDTYLGPTKDYDETVYNIYPYADSQGKTLAVLHNAKATLGVAIHYNVHQLPVFGLWKNTDTLKQGYVTGLEPGTSFSFNRKFQRKLGLVPTINPGETKHFDVTYQILDNHKAVEKQLDQVKSIQGDHPIDYREDPLVVGG
ncbi:aldose 1-epimerase family protein [Celerinatantimonas yamalensis]|uniref:Aldose 1-epimerase family protein n=1 Tax=Celerinatantimonas yamalensis TaxID=559956 RepID=A0ABW9G6F6_9GAMM